MMRISRGRASGAACSAVLALALGLFAVVDTVALSTPAFAQTALTREQLSQIQNTLAATIQASKGDSVAIQFAITQALQEAIAKYGSDAVASITSAVLTVSEDAGVHPAVIGVAVAQAAVAVSATDPAAAAVVATTVANQGQFVEVASFLTTATASGSSTAATVATAANASAAPTAETAGTSSSSAVASKSTTSAKPALVAAVSNTNTTAGASTGTGAGSGAGTGTSASTGTGTSTGGTSSSGGGGSFGGGTGGGGGGGGSGCLNPSCTTI